MSDFISQIIDDEPIRYGDTQNSLLNFNREDRHGDFVLSCLESQSDYSQTYDFMRNNSNKKEHNLEIIREEESSIYNNLQHEFQDYQEQKREFSILNSSNRANKGNQNENLRDQLETTTKAKKNTGYNSNITEKMKKISQEIDDICEQTQKSESVKTINLGVNDISSNITMNKMNVESSSNAMVNQNFQNMNQGHYNNIGNFQNSNKGYGNFNRESTNIPAVNTNHTMNPSTNYQPGKFQNCNGFTSAANINSNINLNNLNNHANINFPNNNNHFQNPKLGLLNSMNPNNSSISMQSVSIANNVPTNKTKGKVTTTNINYPLNPSNNGTPVGFYSESSGANNNLHNLNLSAVSSNNTLNMPIKSNNPGMKVANPSNFELCNSYRSETDENIKKAIGIFDNIKFNLCNFIDNYKNKFIHDAEMLKQVLLAETEHVILEEEKNRMIDNRMEALFRDMMNILNEFQRY